MFPTGPHHQQTNYCWTVRMFQFVRIYERNLFNCEIGGQMINIDWSSESRFSPCNHFFFHNIVASNVLNWCTHSCINRDTEICFRPCRSKASWYYDVCGIGKPLQWTCRSRSLGCGTITHTFFIPTNGPRPC